jgi:very-short-patch-repair endonuclease
MREGQKREAARALRRNSTDVERSMWRLLRDRRFAGIKFRRQVPIGPYVADFASIQHRLVVEVDGGQHGGASDERRDVFLARQGWRVIRFWNSDILQNRNGVLEHLLHLAKAPSPQPSPANAGEGAHCASGTRFLDFPTPRR